MKIIVKKYIQGNWSDEELRESRDSLTGHLCELIAGMGDISILIELDRQNPAPRSFDVRFEAGEGENEDDDDWLSYAFDISDIVSGWLNQNDVNFPRVG